MKIFGVKLPRVIKVPGIGFYAYDDRANHYWLVVKG